MVADVQPASEIGVCEAKPEISWTLEELAQYVAEKIATSKDIEDGVRLLARRSTVAFFRAGQALSIARERLKETGDWVAWQEEHGLKRTTVFEAIQLFEKAKVEEAVAKFGLTEAKKQFGISGNTGKTAEERQKVAAAKNCFAKSRNAAGTAANPAALIRVAIAQIETALAAAAVVNDMPDEMPRVLTMIESKVKELIEMVLARVQVVGGKDGGGLRTRGLDDGLPRAMREDMGGA